MANSQIVFDPPATMSSFTEDEENCSYLNNIERNFGRDTKKLMKKCLNLTESVAHLENQAFFHNKCRSKNLMPRSYRYTFGPMVQGVHPALLTNLAKDLRRRILSARSKSYYIYLKAARTDLSNVIEMIKTTVPEEIATDFLQHNEAFYIRKCEAQKLELNDKFHKIKAENIKRHFSNMKINENWIKNLTDVDVPTNVKYVLSLGEKFAVKKKLNRHATIDTIARIEAATSHLTNALKNEIRCKTSNILTNHLSKPVSLSPNDALLAREISTTKHFVKENPDLIVTRADKGSVTVLISRDEYVRKMNEMLSDTTTYSDSFRERTYNGKVVDINITVQNRVNNFITCLQSKKYITDFEAKKLKSHSSVLPKAYGLVKIHKPGNPFRIIISSVNSPTYDLAKYFSNILGNVVGKADSHVKHAKEFKEKVKEKHLPRNYRLFSLDVSALFTNISKRAVVRAITRRWPEIKKFTNLTLAAFTEGIELIYDNCYFQFNDKKYQQIFGSPMGSPISPVLAELVLEDLEQTVLSRLKHRGINVAFYHRYVDDCATAANIRHIDNILEEFNNYDREGRLKFTIEHESEGNLPFLDLKIIRNSDGSLSFDWYHKDTWSGRYLNYNSYLPLNYKRNTVQILSNKILELADEKFHDKNFTLLQDTLLENGYPTKFIKTFLRRQNNDTTPPQPKPSRYVSLPYDHVCFGKLKSLLKLFDIEVVGKAQTSFKELFFSRLKDAVPKSQKSDLVYEITCECEATYVGQTSQYAETRFNQHLNGTESHSSLSAHLIETGHTVTFDDFKILCSEPNRRVRDVKEVIHIQSQPNRLNSQVESGFLSSTYFDILKIRKTPIS